MMTTPAHGAERRNVPCTIAIPREDLVELERIAAESGPQLYGRSPTYADIVRRAVRELIGRDRDARQARTTTPATSRPTLAKKTAKARARR